MSEVTIPNGEPDQELLALKRGTLEQQPFELPKLRGISESDITNALPGQMCDAMIVLL
jgi:hypothetical protein